MRSAGLDKWTGKVGEALDPLCQNSAGAEDFAFEVEVDEEAFEIEDKVDSAGSRLFGQVYYETTRGE